ncbi:unnamed protein product [Heligmosomoides polygyrus]|uniref:Uncharacterized protein n=2 Tax=Heligmosomoides polygyrus TaxID=6339 RepID=A0A183GMC9_HELPZ|nr:unnamed protein product [Heligmosomoides polygyrus]
MKLCGSVSALTVRPTSPTSDHDDEDVEAFYSSLEKFYREDHALYNVFVSDFNAKIWPRRLFEEQRFSRTGLESRCLRNDHSDHRLWNRIRYPALQWFRYTKN